jgi:predicted ATP-grasp superfamily ATP-dependent carboligase
MARQVYRVAYADGRFDQQQLIHVLQRLQSEDIAGLVYGSGFEASADLLDIINDHVPVIGNSSQVLRNLKRPRQFFMLLDVLGILHPEVSFRPLENASGWLYKQGGGSGGTHIRKALPLSSIGPQRGHYFQRELRGTPVSLLFAANGKQARAIGFNMLWMSPTASMPYRYGGAASHARLAPEVEQQLTRVAQQATNAVGLRGLNSLDAVVEEGRAYVLEINPRLSATFDLYQSPPGANANLLTLHLQACAGNMDHWPELLPTARAHHIAYASRALKLPVEFAWPGWVADIPLPGSTIPAGQPVCTIQAEGETTEAAREAALAREAELGDIIAAYQITG